MTVSKLNMSWRTAPAKALSKSSRFDICVRATTVFVTEVPIFAPIIIGMATVTGNTKEIQIDRRYFKNNGQTCNTVMTEE